MTAAVDLDRLGRRLARALAARLRVLERTTNAEIVGVFAALGRNWCDPTYAPRRELLEALAPRLSIDPGMLARGLDHTFGALSQEALDALLAEAGVPAAMESPVERPRHTPHDTARLLGPPVVTYLLAGNVPGLAIFPIVASLLARSVCVVRESSRQPLLTEAFVATLGECSSELAGMVVAGGWPATDAGLTRALSDASTRVEIYGSDDTVRQISRAYRSADAAAHTDIAVVERGTRTSAAVVVGDVDLDVVAEALAEDVVLYDGKGCLTPHQIVVEGETRRARRLAEHLAGALARFEARWPRQARDLASETDRRAFLAGAEASGLAHDDELLLRGDNDAWAIHLTPRGRIRVGPGLRCVEIVPAPSRQDVLSLLEKAEAPLAAIAVARSGSSDRDRLVARLRQIGATLVCEPGRMQAPPLTWQQDGRRRLGDLLTWQPQERRSAPGA